jgi:hypothetical protein
MDSAQTKFEFVSQWVDTNIDLNSKGMSKYKIKSTLNEYGYE